MDRRMAHQGQLDAQTHGESRASACVQIIRNPNDESLLAGGNVRTTMLADSWLLFVNLFFRHSIPPPSV